MAEDGSRCWMMDRSKLFGQIGMILCWYWDGSNDPGEEDGAIRAVSMIPDLLRGNTVRHEICASRIWQYLGCQVGMEGYSDSEKTPA